MLRRNRAPEAATLWAVAVCISIHDQLAWDIDDGEEDRYREERIEQARESPGTYSSRDEQTGSN
jgi:hypothetical protein